MAQILSQRAMGYDRAITVFSPDGRLLQVEYAKKAVNQGAMTLGIVYKDGVLLIADRRIREKLQISESIRKIYKLGNHLLSTFSGLTSDARVLVRKCRVFAQQHKLTYGEAIDVESLVKYLCDLEQMHTLYGGIRPFGVSFLIAGCDKKGFKLFSTEPSGIYWGFKARAIGLNSDEANKLLDKKYKDGMSKEDAVKLAIDIFKKVLGKDFSYGRLETAAVTEKGTEDVNIERK
ncbi:archaeal proteasome endopeptidase complex subunit alpha [Candidatus Woesearchaeota archaeon]|nr:archaeal proteasome endopeptidase complex subunit alpha [Candidatus Woesearchaeota archaeon]